jgi:hypothetical protein
MELLEQAAKLLEEEYPDQASERVKAWNRIERGKGQTITTPYFLRSLAQEIREDLQKELLFRWQELRGVEVVAAEIGASVDGDDILEPETRAQLDATIAAVRTLNNKVSSKPRPLPEAGVEFLEQSRSLMNQGFAALKLVDV